MVETAGAHPPALILAVVALMVLLLGAIALITIYLGSGSTEHVTSSSASQALRVPRLIRDIDAVNAIARARPPGWIAQEGALPAASLVTWSAMEHRPPTRESGHFSIVDIVDAPEDGDGASVSIELITSGTGEFANATGYLYVTGFINAESHVTSSVTEKICTP